MVPAPQGPHDPFNATAIRSSNVMVGPEDVDRASEFVGQKGVHKQAKRLIKSVADMHPPELMAALAQKVQVERTKALDLKEVQKATQLDHVVTGAGVHGQDGGPYRVCYTYTAPSGRSAKGMVPYEDCPKSKAKGDRIADAIEARSQQAVPGFDGTAAVAPTASGPSDREIELEELVRSQNDRLAALEARLDQPPAQVEAGPELPWSGYDGENAKAIIETLGKLGDSAEDRAYRDAVVAYESAQAEPRKTVLDAARQQGD